VAALLAVPQLTAAVPRVPESLPGAPPLPAELRARLEKTLDAQAPDYEPRTRNLRPDGSPLYTNRLLLESSPYLRQHAHNPVNWYPWGEAAFAEARRLGRPLLVSIGYSTCHWCHVMEEESFDDPVVAEQLNAHFIAIKVDREVRPDVDAVYMSAAQALTGSGGWPLNVFVTPDRKPFYAGTYFPPEDRGRRPAFKTILARIQSAWENERARLDGTADRLAAAVRADLENVSADGSWAPDARPVDEAVRSYRNRFDSTWGGLGRGTKFPSSLPVRLLLRQHRRTGDALAREMALLTLEKMAAGGMRDHVGGGFHRYTTEPRWLVPHFEKMLYDNALLAMAYTEAWQATEREDFAAVARETLAYLDREMSVPKGGFASASDADSRSDSGEMEEGWFFTWTAAEIREALPEHEASAVIAYYSVTDAGNFEGRNILHAWRERDAVAAELGVETAVLIARLESARRRLYEARARRPPPLRDDKVLVAWNGLAISAFARAGFAFAESALSERAARAADFLLRESWKDGRLARVWKSGSAAGPAFLEDYAFLIAGLLDLYEAQHAPRWLEAAVALQAALDRHYADDVGGAYFKSADDGQRLIAREKPAHDGAVPSGNSVTALNLLRLGALTSDPAYRERAGMLFSAFEALLNRRPTSMSELLVALDFQLEATREIALVRPSPPASADGSAALLERLRTRFFPNRVLSVVVLGADQEAHAARVPWVSNKPAPDLRTTAYVCVNRVCDSPTADPEVFESQIAKPLFGSP
jgi:uncharacterized protein YyaL (SSP411 family)